MRKFFSDFQNFARGPHSGPQARPPIFEYFYFISYDHEIWKNKYSYQVEQNDIYMFYTYVARGPPSGPHLGIGYVCL